MRAGRREVEETKRGLRKWQHSLEGREKNLRGREKVVENKEESLMMEARTGGTSLIWEYFHTQLQLYSYLQQTVSEGLFADVKGMQVLIPFVALLLFE